MSVLDGQEIPRAASWVSSSSFSRTHRRQPVRRRTGVFRGVTGTAVLRLPCARPPIFGPVLEHPDVMRLNHAVEVVAEVLTRRPR